MSLQPPLSLERVDKTLARRQVLSDIGFSCSPGSVTGLLGTNGAGKTTTVTLATGLRRPDRGSVRVFGLNPVTAEARRHFSLIPQEISFPGPVRVGHCLDFVEGQRAPSSYAVSRDQLCDELGLVDLLHRSVGGLSGGQRRRLAVAMGLIRVPGLLILDEATTNLDEAARRATWRLVTDYAGRGGAVLATTHILADIDANADRVIAMAGGRVVRHGTMSEIRQSLGGSTVSAVATPQACAELTNLVSAAELGVAVAGTPPGRLVWRTQTPLQLVAFIATIDPMATDLVVAATPLAELLDQLSPQPTPSEPELCR
jgi:ABC-2 type transport system ATP-binding protein